MKNSLLTSISIVAAAMGSLFALPNAVNLYAQESSAGESNAVQNNPATSNSLIVTAENFINFVQNPPPTDTLVFKRKLAFYPRAFATQEQVDQFLDDVDAGRISEEELSGPGEFFAVRHLPDRRFIIQSLNHPKDAWNGSVRLREFNGHSDEYWWGLNSSGVISTDSPNGIYLLKRDKIEMDIFPIAYRQATEFFRLGMYEVDVNTIQIKETPPALAAKGEIPFQAEVLEGFGSGDISGTLFTTEDRSGSNNRIARIRYSRSKPYKGIAGRLIELSYRNNQLSLVRISNYQKNGEKPSHYADYLVIKYIPAREPYLKGYCGWKQFTSESDGWVNIKQNGDEYDMDHNPPRLIPVEDGFETLIFGNPLFNFAVIILIPLAVVWFLYRRSKRTQ